MYEDLIEKKVSSEAIFDGVLLHVKRDTVTLPNGKEATREWIKHPGASSVIPILPDGRIILVRQYRYPIGEVTLEVPVHGQKDHEAHDDRDDGRLLEREDPPLRGRGPDGRQAAHGRGRVHQRRQGALGRSRGHGAGRPHRRREVRHLHPDARAAESRQVKQVKENQRRIYV